MSVGVFTAYRYVTTDPNICGGRPIIAGTRTPIQTIINYYKQGLSVEEILEGLPHLTPAQVYEALSYYHDHTAEIERTIEASRVENLLVQTDLSVDEKGRLI